MSESFRLLLVEDSDTDADLISRQLAKGGLAPTVQRVQTEADFVSALQGTLPDLILSDFALPKFDGLRALEIATARAPETPFIYVSGTIGEERAIDALKRGATDYVFKTNLSRLSSAVERALREAAARAEQRRGDQLRRDQEVRLHRLTRSYRMLSSTGSAILRLRNRTDLLDELCRIAVQQGGYDRVVISLVDPNAEVLRPHAWAGVNSQALRALDYAVAEADSRSGAAAERAVRCGVPVIQNDLSGEATLPERSQFSFAHDYRAVAALPLLIDGTAIGVITLFSTHRNIFDEAEVAVLMELTANLSYALQYLEKDEAVHFLSYFDSLTGLAKRPLFCQRLANQLVSDAVDGLSRTVVVFDIQKLGAINDTLGRYVGDRLIEKIAARLKQSYPNAECAAYFGGGTFALTVPDNINTEDTGRMLQTAAAQLFVEPYEIDGSELRPAVRSGVAFYPLDADTAEVLVQNAEAALTAAREDNEKYKLYGLVTKRPTSSSVALEARLGSALDRQEYLLHYQPKVDITTGRITGLEALLRWRDTQDGLVPPSVFIPLLERSGAIVEVGEWVLIQAVRDMQDWLAAGAGPVRVAVNVSPVQLRQRHFVNHVLKHAEPLNQEASRLDIEITESTLMQDLELSTRKLSQVREAGISVAIDDFGTGYSSLRLLGRLPVDTLKIDRSFIVSIGDTEKSLTLVSTIVSLARVFNMHTVAEGVETIEQMQMLRQVKCDQAQGYYIARPTEGANVPSVIGRLSQ